MRNCFCFYKADCLRLDAMRLIFVRLSPSSQLIVQLDSSVVYKFDTHVSVVSGVRSIILFENSLQKQKLEFFVKRLCL